MFQKVNPKQNFAELEHQIITSWKEHDIFKKSVEKNRGKKKFVFFDGPPFANGLPHYGHILALSLKDAVTRYFNMRGYYVPRTNGWDCHGLPVEYQIEKELGITGKKAIEEYGIGAFNKKCLESVFRYSSEWEQLFERLGRWVDLDESYATKDNSYMESIWWVFKQIYDKGLVYQGNKAMHICPRCSTPLSNFEVTLGYKDVTDTAVTIKFRLVDEPNTYLLAWTTTPWSIISVMGLAVSNSIAYVKVKSGDDFYILAEKRLNDVFHGTDKSYEIVDRFSGDKLLHLQYEHIFDCYNNYPDVLKSQNAFHTVATEYVSDEEGTGIVTINGAFGEDDMNAALKNNIPIILNVGLDGAFDSDIPIFGGKFVIGQNQNIAQYIDQKGLLFKKENYRHSYPHCWRCDTPLLNYSTKSWFIKVTDIKTKLARNNQKISWQPPHIKEGRFGKWLENVRDWAISRNRYFGCAIPIWKCSCGHELCIESIDDLSRFSKNGITLFAARHGEYSGILDNTLNADSSVSKPLTDKGVMQANNLGLELRNEKIDSIYVSELPRTQETAKIISKIINSPVITESLLNEFQFKSFEGKTIQEYQRSFTSVHDYLSKPLDSNCETFAQLIDRMKKFVLFIRSECKGKKILLVTHGSPLEALSAALGRATALKAAYKSFSDQLTAPCSFKKFIIGNDPLNEENFVDLHKPFIDSVYLDCPKCRGRMERIPEVLDCWFESGAMPYAQLHYPFEDKKEFEENFPAEFIAEGLDQTRGWFYTLHVLAAILFNKPAFKNVIVNGILLAADGEKLSKRKKNYPDPHELFEKMGADSVRFFLLSSPAALADDVRFSEKHVDEIVKKITLTLWNSYYFFTTYAVIDKWKPSKKISKPSHKLDLWILSELQILIINMTESMDKYNLMSALKPIFQFIDDLSNWYIRRSRRRFWKSENDTDKKEAYSVLHYVLVELTKLLAPFMPFISDAIYQNLTSNPSVHLESWPKANKRLINEKLHEDIFIMRKIVELGHSARATAKVKVRQPLQKAIIALPKHIDVPNDVDVIKEELNIKELSFIRKPSEIADSAIQLNFPIIGKKFGQKTKKLAEAVRQNHYEIISDLQVKVLIDDSEEILSSAKEEFFISFKPKSAYLNFSIIEGSGIVLALDCLVSNELKQEGIIRDFIRLIQEIRKKANFNVEDKIYLFISAPDFAECINNFADVIRKETLTLELQVKGDFQWDMEDVFDVEGKKVKIGVRRAS